MGFHLWHYVCTQKFSYFGVLWILDCHGFWISDAQPIVTVETVEELCGLLRVVHGIGGHLTHGKGHRPTQPGSCLPSILEKAGLL